MQNSGVEGPSIFVAHPSQHLTDYVANGDGLIAYSFLCGLAERGYVLHVAAETISIQKPLPRNVTLYPLRLKTRNRGLRLLEYSIRLRLLFRKLSRQHDFRLILQMNPVYPGLSLALLGTSLPVLLGTYVPRWESAPDQFKDGYRGSTRWAAWARDRVVALQQRFASALLLTSPAAMNRVPAPAQNAAKIFHLPHPIDVELFRPPDSSSEVSALKQFGILFVGSVSRRKGIFDLLTVLPAVLRACPQAHLTVVGPGDDLEQVREFVAQSEHRDQISILGPVQREATAEFYRQHAVYCLPSYGEPYATTLLEAMASGLPIVSTNTGGTPFLVPAEGGRLVTPGDTSALGAALVEVLLSPSLRESMGQRNREETVSFFATSKVLDRLESIYYAVSKGRVGRPIVSLD